MDEIRTSDAGADHEYLPTRDVYVADDDGQPLDELTIWLRAQVATGDVRAAESIENVLDHYERKCREATTNPAVEMECTLIWSVIQHLALAYEDRSGYRDEWRP